MYLMFRRQGALRRRVKREGTYNMPGFLSKVLHVLRGLL
jgi:hypothetical protein